VNIVKKYFFFIILIFSGQVTAEDNKGLSSSLYLIEKQINQEDTIKEDERENFFNQLTSDLNKIIMIFPNSAEPLILKSRVLLTKARDAFSLSALSLVEQAENLLSKAIDINPTAKNGAALVTMGVMYHKVPGWPISFGDNKIAEGYLLKALEINPDGSNSNFYYANFLIEIGEEEKAISYLNKVLESKSTGDELNYKEIAKQKREAKLIIKDLT